MDTIIIGIIVTVVGGLLLALLKRRFLPSESVSPKESKVHFDISLEQGQLIEGNASVFLDGKHIGTLSVGPRRQDSIIHAKVPRAGRYNYAVQGNVRLEVYDQQGAKVPVTFPSNGEGIIEVSSGTSFKLTLNNALLGEGGGGGFYALIDPFDKGIDQLDKLRGELQEIVHDLEEDEIIGGAELLTFLDDNYERLGMSQSEYRRLVKEAAVDEIVRRLRERGWVE